MEENEDLAANRFAHLLKPIKELAENWNIDIASELVEYLDELDKIVISFQDGDLNVNFAEAALLIQGSAAVYGKKVECLYDLVFQTLERIAEQKDGEKTKRTRKHRESGIFGLGDRDQFLLLDDEINIGAKINLEDNQKANVKSMAKESLREKIPFALVGNRTGIADSTGIFKMMSCDIDESGAFIIDEQDRADLRTDMMMNPAVSTHDAPLQDDDTFDDANGNDDGYMGSPEHEPILASSSTPEPNRSGCSFSSEEEDEDDELAKHAWDFLDPHDVGDSSLNAPFKKGTTWKVPAILKSSEETRRAHTQKSVSLSNMLTSLSMCPTVALRRMPKQPTQALYPEFKSYIKERRTLNAPKSETRIQRAAQRSRPANNVVETVSPEDDDEEEAYFSSNEDAAGDVDESEAFYYGAGMSSEPYIGELSETIQGDIDGTRMSMNLNDRNFSEPPDTYLHMVKAHLQKYLDAAKRWASESTLHATVRQWEEKIEPMLEIQTNRAPFDIHDYGSKILSSLQHRAEQDEANQEASFEDLAKEYANQSNDDQPENKSGLDQFEVCRLFLASLQLANNGNVELSHDTNMSTLHIRTKDLVLANEKLKDFVAPSLYQQKNDSSDKAVGRKRQKKAVESF